MPASCLDRFSSEFNPCQDWYSVGDIDGDFDVEASFAPCNLRAVALKFVSLLYVTFVCFYSLWESDNRGLWFGYLTNITLIFSVIYIWLSTFNSVIGVEQPRPRDNVSFMVGAQWYMFHVAMHANLIVVLLYWAIEFEPKETDLDFLNLSTHAGTCLVLLLEGFGVNFIPIRWFYYWGAGMLVGLAYMGWTIIQSKSDIDGDPSDPESDLLYDAIDWEDNLGGTITFYVLCLVVVGPFFQGILFSISIYGQPFCCGKNKRRYIADKDTDEEDY